MTKHVEEKNVCNRVQQCKMFDEEKELGDRELQSRVEKEEEESSTVRR